jgi:hypothetical protein
VLYDFHVGHVRVGAHLRVRPGVSRRDVSSLRAHTRVRPYSRISRSMPGMGLFLQGWSLGGTRRGQSLRRAKTIFKTMKVTFKTMKIIFKTIKMTFKTMKIIFKTMKMTFKTMKIIFNPMKMTFIRLKLIFNPMKMTFIGIELIFNPMKMTFIGLKLTFNPMKVTFKTMKTCFKIMKIPLLTFARRGPLPGVGRAYVEREGFKVLKVLKVLKVFKDLKDLNAGQRWNPGTGAPAWAPGGVMSKISSIYSKKRVYCHSAPGEVLRYF